MPEMDGVEACQHIKNVPNLSDIPVIMVTGIAAEEKLEQAFDAGATDYIVKPTSPGGNASPHRLCLEPEARDGAAHVGLCQRFGGEKSGARAGIRGTGEKEPGT